MSMSAYLLLFPELHLHLFVTRLVLADAVAGDEVAADVSKFWVLFPRLFDQTEEDTSVKNSVFNRVLVQLGFYEVLCLRAPVEFVFLSCGNE